jgi:hypothetical protein
MKTSKEFAAEAATAAANGDREGFRAAFKAVMDLKSAEALVEAKISVTAPK